MRYKSHRCGNTHQFQSSVYVVFRVFGNHTGYENEDNGSYIGNGGKKRGLYPRHINTEKIVHIEQSV
jgi:hypothetical protein